MRKSSHVNDRGFTLLEVLVGLAVCATVLAAMTGVYSWNLRQASVAGSRLELAAVERSVLATELGRRTLDTGQTSGQSGRVTWRMNVVPVRTIEQRSAPGWTLFHVTLALEGPDDVRGGLETFRIGRAPP